MPTAFTGTHVAVTAALAGAAAGGGFALLSQMIGKSWDAMAARTTRCRQANGLLASVLAEVMCNLKALAKLVDELELLTTDNECAGWDPVARHRLKTWLTTSGIRDQEWFTFASSDVASEFSPDARVILSECYDQVRAMQAAMACEVDSPYPVFQPSLDYYLNLARESVQYSSAFALGIAYAHRRLRRSAVWFHIVRTLAWYGGTGRRFSETNWVSKESRRLRSHVLWICRQYSEKGEGIAMDCAVALAVLGIGPEPVEIADE